VRRRSDTVTRRRSPRCELVASQRLEHQQADSRAAPPAGPVRVADAPIESNVSEVAGFDDVEDWVGEPPESRYSRDRAKPECSRGCWPLSGAA
jgi:hypothetical protein